MSQVSDAAMDAARWAHHQRGLPCLRLEVGALKEKTLGYLCAYFETLCAVSALLLDVNPFDQPGVEAYKKQMHQILNR
jgi:glucose-6-phosphate isomerase